VARMIPAVIAADTISPGERELFDSFLADPGTQDWTVLHSLDLARHERAVGGEADFVLIVPGKGILVLEVKGCRRIARTDEGWFYGNDPSPDKRGPFRQAGQAMHAIRELLGSDPELAKVLCWSAVVLPYLDFDEDSIEWHSWQVMDKRAFRVRPFADAFLHVLDQARRRVREDRSQRWFNAESPAPTAGHIARIVERLRPQFEFFESPRSRAERVERELRRYTEQQFEALDQMSMNDRVLFSGPAGTGKTLLAIEAARRSAEAGRRTLLTCYNRELGRWLQDQTRDLSQVRTVTLHAQMQAVAGNTGADQLGPDYWERDLPERALDRLLDLPSSEQFDELIIDEAQDLLRDTYLDFLDVSLAGGLARGRWRMFGDFERQAIFDRGSDVLKQLESRQASFARMTMRKNCRNRPRVAEYIHLLGGLRPRYSDVLLEDDGVEPKLVRYKSEQEQVDLLIRELDALLRDGFTPGQIVVLSTRATNSCAGQVETSPWRDRMKPFTAVGAGATRFGSIHAFKGLESPTVVLTDIDRFHSEHDQDLFYVGASRPTQRLVILLNEVATPAVVRALTEPKGEGQLG